MFVVRDFRSVDGVEQAVTTVDGSEDLASLGDSDTPARIGTAGVSGGLGNYWNGFIDEIEVFNRALTGAEAQALYDA